MSALQLVKILFDPDVSKKMILNLAWNQAKAFGLAKVLAKLLGSGIVVGAAFTKWPQIRKLVEDRKVVSKGLSLKSLYLELFCELVHVVYNQDRRIGFVDYGESVLLGIQNLVLVLMVHIFRANRQDMNELYGFSVWANPSSYMAATLAIISALPQRAVNGLELLNIPLGVASKLAQINTNYELQSALHLSRTTVGVSTLGSLVRLYTTMQLKRKDWVLLAGYGASFAVNAALLGQIHYYGSKDIEGKKMNE
ncbi:uncharacterized protein KQ657_003085 [Scheffersomyces spartinae]|uniref:Solute carrier family 66 member 3 n=1 Tax=Scheffersomyces spartinae TaxID=45513 RepID=A0A9P7V5F4_9ASCO|nr:uncharacterized protein KQ657_003085 [Scheffersomyces spartinae]KAG7191490.1 hypothetical protein KQ657_003085 [Scheffersomyces spartinae]